MLSKENIRLFIFSAALMLAAPYAWANPMDGTVSAGSATITSDDLTTTINQETDRTVIDWGSFDISSGETTNFIQPSSSSIALNRIHSGQSSYIDGLLTANGNIIIVNQSGVVFGSNATVNVGGLIASTADITNENFMAGNFDFNIASSPAASIKNFGTITAKEAGLIGFVAPTILNSGIIKAKYSKIQLASGDTFQVDFYGDGLINVAASDTLTEQLIQNTGSISNEGGEVYITAAAAAETVDSLVEISGEISTKSVSEHNGKIVISSEGENSSVNISGNLDTSSDETSGGEISVSAKNITVDSDAFLNVSAGQNGDGGSIILLADKQTTAKGTFWAKGGEVSGDGGSVETSGAEIIYDGIAVDTSAENGAFGEWLIDPEDLTVDQTAADTISTNLGSTNVTLQTTSTTASGTGNVTSGDGDITIEGNIAATGTGNLTLSAYHNITISSSITLQGGTLLLRANNADVGAGNITIESTATIQTNGGDITMGGGSGTITAVIFNADGSVATAASGYAYADSTYTSGIYIAGTVHAGGGNIIANGSACSTCTTNGNYGVRVTGTSAVLQTTGSGTISISGYGFGADTSTYDHGVVVDYSGLISVENGGLYVYGVGGVNSTGQANYGFSISSDNSTVQSTGSGDIVIYGIAYETVGNYSHAISLIEATGILSTGSGNVILTGLSNSTTSIGNIGIYLRESAVAITGSGSITLSAATLSEGSHNYAIDLVIGGSLSTTSGDIHVVTAVAAATTTAESNNNTAFKMSGTSSVTSVDGNILFDYLLSGGGSAGYGDNVGLRLSDSSHIETTGTGNIVISFALGGGGYAGTHGICLETTGGIITSGNGSITIVAQSAGTSVGYQNYGLYITSGSIQTNGTGSITILAAGGGGNPGNNSGIKLSSANSIITTGSGNITLVSVAGSGSNSYGLLVDTANAVQTTGTGNIIVYTDTISLPISSSIVAAGYFALSSYTDISIGVGDSASGTLLITDTLISYIDASSYVFGNLTTWDGSTASQDMVINSSTDFGDADVTFISGGNITLAGSLTKATGTSESTVLLKAAGDITNSNSAGIITQSGPLNIVMWSDADANSSGYINLYGSTFTTKGGDFYLAGGSDDDSDGRPDGYAWAWSSSERRGVYIGYMTLSTETGDIYIKGHGYNDATALWNEGVQLEYSDVTTTSGNVTIIGVNEESSNFGLGVSINNGSSITSETGDVLLQGTSLGDGINSYAINLSSDITVTGAGSITLQGQSTNGVDVMIDDCTISTAVADILIEGNRISTYHDAYILSSGSGSITLIASLYTILTQSSSHSVTVGGANMTGDISITTNTYGAAPGTLLFQTQGKIYLKQYNSGTSVGLLGASGDQTITSAILPNLYADGGVIIGGDNAAEIRIGTGTFNSDASITSGSGRVIFSGVVTMGSHSLFAQAADGYDLYFQSGSGITSSASGDAVILVSGGYFYNLDDSDAINLSGDGRWLIYAATPTGSTFAGLNSNNTAYWNATYATLSPSSITGTGSYYIFAYQPTLTLTTTDATKTYGEIASLSSSYVITGYESGITNAFQGDYFASALTGNVSITSTGSSPSATTGTYAITADEQTLSATTGYNIVYNNAGTLTVLSNDRLTSDISNLNSSFATAGKVEINLASDYSALTKEHAVLGVKGSSSNENFIFIDSKFLSLPPSSF